MKTDFGNKRPRQKKESGEKSLSVKVKGHPPEVHKILDKMSGAGDMKPPNLRGPRGMHPVPEKLKSQEVPALYRPLGVIGGKKPKLSATSTGVGDPPAALRGGSQPLVSMTRVAVYKRPVKPSAPIKSNNPESPAGSKGPKAMKPLNSHLLLKFPEAEPPRTGRTPKIDTRMPMGAEPRRAPAAKMIQLKVRREPAITAPGARGRLGKRKG